MRQILSFDLDGTLVDSVGDLASAINVALTRCGLVTVEVEAVRRFVGGGARQLIEHVTHHVGAPDRTDDVLFAFREAYDAALLTETRVFPGVVACLTSLQHRAPDVALVVCTNKPGRYARPLVHALLPGVFSLVIGPDDAGALKPDPAMLIRAETELQGRVIAHIGDSPFDLATAVAHGCRSVAVLWGLSPPLELQAADATAPDAAALLDALVEILGLPTPMPSIA